MTKNDQQQDDFANFVRVHHAQLRGFLRVLGVSNDSVDDLAQETFLIAYKDFSKYKTDHDFGKWLRGIARNLVLNETRKSARRSRILNTTLTEHLLATNSPDLSPERFEYLDFCALRDCLGNLPNKSRMLISGRYADEWNASLLADQFDMSPNAVRLALMRIRKQLKICIERRLANA